ncbi:MULTISPECIES: SAV_915 family protein [Kitasatospora]|uniref:SseB protein N-terminal domain-containing protein n=1 Tax=Kitasatospora cystarginea TaxID=58350 RepID=A0ABN3DWW9_9ACTN
MTSTETAPEEPDEHTARYVPVRSVGTASVLRFFRRRDGSRCVLAFGSAADARELLGPEQELIDLALPALREMIAPLGVRHIVLDPKLVAPAVTDTPQRPFTALEPQR